MKLPLLAPGDAVALLAPASPLKSREEVARCIALLEGLGLEVVPYPSLHERADYLAGSDALRAEELHRAFSDPKVRAVFALRGGYGTARLLPLLDFDFMRRDPKLLVGFSDLTSLQNAMVCHGIPSLHAPTTAWFLEESAETRASLEALRQWLFGPRPTKIAAPVVVTPGRREGILVGGNLTVFASLCGSCFLPDPRGKIVFFEDIHEKPYRLDRCLTQLANARWLGSVSGVLLGSFADCDAGTDRDDVFTVLERCLRGLGVPVLGGIAAGHGRPSVPLPMGVLVMMDSTKGMVSWA